MTQEQSYGAMVPYKCFDEFMKISKDHADYVKDDLSRERSKNEFLEAKIEVFEKEQKKYCEVIEQLNQENLLLSEKKRTLEDEQRMNQSFLDMKSILEMHPEFYHKLRQIVGKLSNVPTDSRTLMMRPSKNKQKDGKSPRLTHDQARDQAQNPDQAQDPDQAQAQDQAEDRDQAQAQDQAEDRAQSRDEDRYQNRIDGKRMLGNLIDATMKQTRQSRPRSRSNISPPPVIPADTRNPASKRKYYQ
jgi:hypothetical protein